MEASCVNASDLLKEAWTLARGRMQARGCHMILTLQFPLPQLRGDRDQLFLVVYNLLDNALQRAVDGHAIEMQAFEDADSLVIEVMMKGSILSETDRLSFTSVTPPRWREAPIPGHGLGLVRTIVEDHGGQVVLRSATDRSSVISIRLPVYPNGKRSRKPLH